MVIYCLNMFIERFRLSQSPYSSPRRLLLEATARVLHLVRSAAPRGAYFMLRHWLLKYLITVPPSYLSFGSPVSLPLGVPRWASLDNELGGMCRMWPRQHQRLVRMICAMVCTPVALHNSSIEIVSVVSDYLENASKRFCLEDFMASVLSCRLCFLRAFPFISLIQAFFQR